MKIVRNATAAMLILALLMLDLGLAACAGAPMPDQGATAPAIAVATQVAPPTDTPVPPTATLTPQLPGRILFIGDSDAFWLDHHMKNLAASEDPPIVIETLGITSGGASLKDHWNLTLGLKAIKEGNWDIVVLNEDLRIHQSEVDKFYEYASKFDQEIKKIGAQTVLYMPQPWKTKMDPPLTAENYAEVYGQLGAELGAKVAPAALAWQRSIQERPDLELYARDGIHGNLHGAYLSLCVLYATIFGRSPVGLAYHLSDIPQGSQEYIGRHMFEGGLDYKTITDEEAAFLQRIAWETVQDNNAKP
jgi:hypothetical protein